MPTMVRIGEKLKRLRMERMLTPAELAEEAGLGANTVYRIERDEVEPHIKTIRALGRALGIDPAELIRD